MTPVHELEAVRPVPTAAPGHTLAIGSRLREYEIKALIGEGTCSIVYLGWDHSLQRKVAIKEYMPAAMAGRVQGSASIVVASARHLDPVKAGLRSFINEARLLGRFDHPSLVKVYRFWEENGTAYMVMPYYEGPTLEAALAELGHVPSEAELRTWLKPILNAVTLLHEGATWHQNIGPDEILLTPFGPVLLGFAGAAHAIEAMNHTPAAALKAGYAAIEQYGSQAGTTRGPWTDLYALAAVVYGAITGSAPIAAADRLTEDRLRPLSLIAAGLYSERFLAAIDAAMAVQPRRRPADHVEFRAMMGDIDAPEAVSLAPRPDLMQEPFVGPAARDREVTVPDRATGAGVPTPSAAPAAAEPGVRATQRAASTPPAHEDVDRASPSWMHAAHARGIGKRALYGVVAGTCALIGIAALVLQLATRPSVRGTTSAAASAAAHGVPAPTPGAIARTTASTTTAAPTATTTATAAAATRPRAASTPAAAAPHPARPVVASVAPNARAAPPAAPAASGRTPALPVRPSVAAAMAPIVVSSPLERQARCTEILQKASLEKITPAETDFFKSECK